MMTVTIQIDGGVTQKQLNAICTLLSEQKNDAGPIDDAISKMKEILSNKISDLKCMPISIRTANCLKSAEIETVSDLVSLTWDEFRQIPTLDRKSRNELDIIVRYQLHLDFGMDVTEYGFVPYRIKHLQNEE